MAGKALSGAKTAAGLAKAGTYSNAVLFGLQATDQAITTGRDNGLEGKDLFTYSAGQGALEAGIMLAAGAIGGKRGITSVEEMTTQVLAPRLKDVMVRSGVDAAWKGLFKVGGGAAAEGAEEGITQFSQNVWSKMYGIQDDVSEGVLFSTLVGAAAGGGVNVPGLNNLRKAARKADVAIAAEVEAHQFAKDNPLRIDDVRKASNKKEFEALTGMKKTSEQYRKYFTETIERDQVGDTPTYSSQEAAVQEAAHQNQDNEVKQAQGEPVLPEPETVQEAAQQEVQVEAAKKAAIEKNRDDNKVMSTEAAVQYIKDFRQSLKDGKDGSEVTGPNGEKFTGIQPHKGELGTFHGQIIENLWAHGIDLEAKEFEGLSHYLGGGYRTINATLRGKLKGGVEPASQEKIDNAKNALNKMPIHEGDTFRGIEFDTDEELIDFVERLEPGKVFTDPGFFSTSKKLTTAQGFGGGAGTYPSTHTVNMIVKSRRGHDVTLAAEHETEQEVLFEPGTSFSVKSAVIDPVTKRVEVVLQDEGPQYDYGAEVTKKQTEDIQEDIKRAPEDYEGHVSLKHAVLDRYRGSLGLETLMSPDRITFEQELQSANEKMDLNKDPRNIASAVLEGRRTVAAKQSEAVAQLEKTGDLDAVANAEAELVRILNEADLITAVGRTAGSAAGRLLNQQKLMIDSDMNLVSVRGRMRANKKKTLSQADEDFAAETTKQYKDGELKEKIAKEKVKNEVNDQFVKNAKKDPVKKDKQALLAKLTELLKQGCELQ
jgi:hypothetical protein